MLDTIIGLFSSAAGGGVLGLLGTVFKGYTEYKEKKLDRDHALALRKLDIESLEVESSLRIKETQLEYQGKLAVADKEAQAARDIGDANIRVASYEHDHKSYSDVSNLKGLVGKVVGFMLGLVDVARGLMRPVITVFLLVITSYIAFKVFTLINLLTLPQGEVVALFSEIVKTILFLTVTAVTWWLGSRPNQK